MGYIHDDGGLLYEFTAELRHQTDKAYLVSYLDKEFWLPKAQTEYDGDITFIVPEWLAVEKGIV